MSDFELFPGFKTPPNDPSREVKNRAPVTVRLSPEELTDEMGDYFEDVEWCDTCENMGYLDCFCGGDLCVCRWNG